MKKIILITLFILSGCSSNVIHVNKPNEIISYDSKLFLHDGYVCMTEESFLKHKLWINDVKRYVIDANDIFCYYNKENCK